MKDRWTVTVVALAVLFGLGLTAAPGWGGPPPRAESVDRLDLAVEEFLAAPQQRHERLDPETALRSLSDVAVTRLRVLIRPGVELSVPITLHGSQVTLDLAPYSVRAPDLRVELRGPGGRTQSLDPGPVRTVRGTVREIPGSVVAGSVGKHGLEVMIRLADETTLWLEPVAKSLAGAAPDLYAASPCDLDEADRQCGLSGSALQKNLTSFSAASTGEGCATLGGCVARILIDADSVFVAANGGTSQAISTIEALMALVNPRYQSPFNIEHKIQQIVLREAGSDPYADPAITSHGGMLGTVASVWSAPPAGVDLVHLLTGRFFGSVVGAAYIDGICSPGFFGMYGYSSVTQASCGPAGIVIHEIGHTWSAQHDSGMMSPFANNCSASWSSTSVSTISSRRDQIDGICLEIANQPPTARFDFTCSGLTCSFVASGSSDDHGIASYTWAFGDSTSGSGATASRTYSVRGSYTVTLTVTDTHGLTAARSRKVSVIDDGAVPAQSYFAINPCRLVDTRSSTPLNSGQSYVYNITGNCGIPATAKAVSVNIGAANPTGQGHLVAYPGNLSSGPFIHASTNFSPATSLPRFNNGILRLATDGTGTLAVRPFVVGSPGQVHLVLDVYGYFSEDTAPAAGAQGPLGYQAVTLCRAADTRSGSPLVHGVPRSFTVQGVCGVPVGAAVGALNLAAVAPTEAGALEMYPAGGLQPLKASVRWRAGTSALANGSRMALSGTTPDVTLLSGTTTTTGTTHALIDVSGYFKSDALLKYRPITACRAVDTRSVEQGAPALAPGSVRTFKIQGNCGVPVGAKAAMVNITVVNAVGEGHLIAFPSGSSIPAASTLNYHPNQEALGNGAIVPLSMSSEDFAIVAAVSGVDVIVDVFGYFQ